MTPSISNISVRYVWKDTIDANPAAAESNGGKDVWWAAETAYNIADYIGNLSFDAEVDFGDRREK